MSEQLIHLLPPHVANQIAAGEVVERPASVVKELVENSIDAGAKSVVVRLTEAGKKRIEVEDDGSGMTALDAEMAVKRHATSKIAQLEDLHHIASHGFRGEALPSIASVSRFRLCTSPQDGSEGVEVRIEHGESEVRPAAPRIGTKIEVLDLFLNTPARLNFMRTDKTEEAAVIEAMRSLAACHPTVALKLELDWRTRLDFPVGQSERERIVAIMGDEFAANSIEQRIDHEGIEVRGHLGLPTYHHRDTTRMLFLVNGRAIRDKQLIAALRAGYRDVMFHDRYPVAVVRIELDPRDVDVNVHPAKLEVRFKSPQAVRAAVVACVRAGIERMGQSVSSHPTERALDMMNRSAPDSSGSSFRGGSGVGLFQPSFRSSDSSYNPDVQRLLFSSPVREPESDYEVEGGLDLGTPLTQIHQCYILSQTADGVILIDQHAAHERITYERLKKQLTEGELAHQLMLTPESWNPGLKTAAWLDEHAASLKVFGVELDAAGEDSFMIRSVPSLLVKEPPVDLVAELAEACMLIGVESEGPSGGNSRVLERWLGNRACKGSIKAGRTLNHQEQEALLREMERTPNIAQCNHGRPTYVRLSLNDLARLFGRKE